MSTILVVDDDPALLKLAEAALRRAGHDVVTTTEPESVLSLATAREVEAVVLDVMMPGRSGYDVLAQLRGDPRTSSLPVLMLSALSDGPQRVRGLSQGADEYVVKPLEPQELVIRLERMLTRAREGSADLEGRLGVLTLGEVLQALLQSNASGVLDVDSLDGKGSLSMQSGQATSATFGPLSGRNAALAMLNLRRGRFRFVRAQDNAPEPALRPGERIPVQGLLFTAAWLDDELNRRPTLDENKLLWPSGEADGPPPKVEGFEALPLSSVWKALLESPGISLGGLLARLQYEARLVRLAVSVLAERGAIRTARAVLPTDPGLVPSEGQRPDLFDAVEVLAAMALRSETSAAQPQALIVVGGSVHGALFELRQGIPTSALSGQADSLVGAWNAGRPAALPLKGRAGTLVVYLVSTEAERACNRLRGRLLGFNGGIATWTASPQEPVLLRWLVDEVERMPFGGGALAVAEGEETTAVTATLLDGAARWRLHRTAPPDFATLLTLMAAAAKPDPREDPPVPGDET